MILHLSKIVHGLGVLLSWIAIALAAPFALAAAWLFDRADDLEGGWRKGRQQNALWQWARNRNL